MSIFQQHKPQEPQEAHVNTGIGYKSESRQNLDELEVPVEVHTEPKLDSTDDFELKIALTKDED